MSHLWLILPQRLTFCNLIILMYKESPGAKLTYKYRDTYVEVSLILSPFNKIIAIGLFLGPTSSLTVDCCPDL